VHAIIVTANAAVAEFMTTTPEVAAEDCCDIVDSDILMVTWGPPPAPTAMFVCPRNELPITTINVLL